MKKKYTFKKCSQCNKQIKVMVSKEVKESLKNGGLILCNKCGKEHCLARPINKNGKIGRINLNRLK